MNTRRNIKVMLVLFALLFALLGGYLVYIVREFGDYWFASPYNFRLSAQKSSVTAGSVYDESGVLLASTSPGGERVYSPDMPVRLSTAHILGDDMGQTLGAQSLFAKYLLGFREDAAGRLSSLVTGEKRRGDDVYLTVNAGLCTYLYSLLGENDGAIIIMDYTSGAILASASRPSFDLEQVRAYLAGEAVFEDGSMVNRPTMGRYTPGSTFKIVTAVAALRYIPNVRSRTFTCTGALAFNEATGELISDAKEAVGPDGLAKEGYVFLKDFDGEVHGSLTLEEAFIHSCNNTFAQIALEVGEKRLHETAESLGLNGEFLFDGLVAYTGTMGKADTDFELAWSGVGQHEDIMTPVHMLMLAGAVASGGTAAEPKVFLKAVSPAGELTAGFEKSEYAQYLTGTEAEFLLGCMRRTVLEGTGKKAAVDKLSVCGKTGTAEVSSSGSIKPHAWFVGFIENDAYPYAICVVLENGGGGGAVAAPLASLALKRAVETASQPSE